MNNERKRGNNDKNTSSEFDGNLDILNLADADIVSVVKELRIT